MEHIDATTNINNDDNIDNKERETAFSLGERDRRALINYLCRRVNRE